MLDPGKPSTSWLSISSLSKFFQVAKGKVKVFLESAGSRLPLAQNTPNAKGAFFGVTYFLFPFTKKGDEHSSLGRYHIMDSNINQPLKIVTFIGYLSLEI